MSADQAQPAESTEVIRDRLPWWKVVAAVFLGGLLASWLASIIVMHQGNYHSDQVLQTGTAVVGRCSNSVFFTKSCESKVTWADGTTQTTQVFSIGRPSGTVAVAQHPTVNSFGATSTAHPVALVKDFPTTAHPGRWRAAIWGITFAGAGVGLLCVLIPHWRRTHEIREVLDQD